jgi:tetratricopeptide (TPR) repeat protein
MMAGNFGPVALKGQCCRLAALVLTAVLAGGLAPGMFAPALGAAAETQPAKGPATQPATTLPAATQATQSDGKARPAVFDPISRGIEAIVKRLAPGIAAPATAPASATLTTKAPPGTIERADELYMRGLYAPAISEYRKLPDNASMRVPAAIGLARALAMTGKYKEALDALGKVQAEGANRAAWHVAMADTLWALGRYDKALDRAAAANGLEPAWAPAIFAHGMVLETLGQKAKAQEVYKTMSRCLAGDAYRKDARSLVALGGIMDRYAVLTGQRASEQASNILHNYLQEAYLKADKGYWPANVAAGTFLLGKHRPDSAGKEFEQARKLNPEIPDAYAGLGAIELEKWHFEKCIALADKALAIQPNHADALLLKANCMMQWRKFDQVPPIVEQVLKANPNHLDALSLMAAVNIRLGQPDKAQPYIDRAHKVNAGYHGLPLATAEWLSAGRQFVQAEKYFRQAISLAPEQAEPMIGLGRMFLQTGDEDKALETLKKAHEIDDFRADAVNFLNLLKKMKDYMVRETDHFIVKVDGNLDAILADQVAEHMEKIYKEITTDYAHEPAEKTIVEFFPNHEDFSVRITGRGWIGTVGASTGRVIALVAPNSERSSFGTHNWAVVLRHEFTHTVTLSATDNRIPHWFTEACAVFQQPDKRNYAFVRMLVTATRTGTLFPMKELDWGFIRPKQDGDRTLAYAQSEWVMEYIIEAKGYDKVIEMIKGFHDGLSQAEVFQRIVGVPEKDFDQAFNKWAHATVKKWGFNPDPPPDLAKADKAAKEKPQDPAAQATLAVALYNRRDKRGAERAARSAIKLDPNSTRALGVLAVILSDNKNYDEAIEFAKKLEAIDHTTSIAPKVLSECHVAKKQWAQAIAALELLQQRQPLDSYSYQQLANIYNQLGQPEKALPNLIHLHRHTMTDPKYARQIAETYRSLGLNDQALTYFEEITHINPYQPNAYEAMAAIYRTNGDFSHAIAAIEKVTLLEPKSADAWAKTAMIRYLAGQAAKDPVMLRHAREDAEKSLGLDPQSRAGQVLERIDDAIQELEKPS